MFKLGILYILFYFDVNGLWKMSVWLSLSLSLSVSLSVMFIDKELENSIFRTGGRDLSLPYLSLPSTEMLPLREVYHTTKTR